MDVPLQGLLVVEAADEEHLLAEVVERREHLAQLHVLAFALGPPLLAVEAVAGEEHGQPDGGLARLPVAGGSSPQTGSDSSQGRAIVTPRPRSMVAAGESVSRHRIDLRDWRGSETSIHRYARLTSADLAELPAADDRLDGGADAVVVGLQLGLHLGQQRLVGKLHGAAERVAQQLAAELRRKASRRAVSR